MSTFSAGAVVPPVLYGTAWKKDETQTLVVKALQTGFRGIDTACQPKHYNEGLVGKAIEQVLGEGWLKREDLFLQTKYTPLGGQDPTKLPYDATAALEEQVQQSLSASLRNLKTTYLDSLVIHSPLPTIEETLRVWKTMEGFVDAGQVRYLGISNCYDLHTLEALYDAARIKPSFVQNRFYSKSHFDRPLRAYCVDRGIVYQSFWTLTANWDFIRNKRGIIHSLAEKYDKTGEQIFFAFIRAIGILPLTGTTSPEHMQYDLEVLGNDDMGILSLEDVRAIELGLYSHH